MKKLLRLVIFSFLTLVILLILGLVVTGNTHIFKAVGSTYLKGKSTANITDASSFKTQAIEKGEEKTWKKAEGYNELSLPKALEDHHKKYKTAGFLVFRDGELLFEKYYTPYDKKSKTNSFSVSKTITTLLLYKAIEEGYIKNLDQKLTDFFPEFEKDDLGKKATVGQLISMTSGYNWEENYYSPFSPTPKLYYGKDSEKFLLTRGFSHKPGTFYYYSSASTQLVGILLTRALQDKTLSQYASEKLWKPLGMNDNATWHTDGKGQELAYCCVSSNARNFAKIGQLLLNGGKWNEKQIVEEKSIEKMLTINPNAAHYGQGVWMDYKQKPARFFSLIGHLGQYVIGVPKHNLLIVRLGEDRPLDKDEEKGVYFNSDLALFYTETLKMLGLEN